MKLRPNPTLFLAVVLGFAATTLPAAPAARPPARTPAVRPADRSARTKERIDTLLKSRLAPDPLPASLANPFQLPGAAVTETRENPPPDLPANHRPDPAGPTIPTLPAAGSDSELLAQYAAGLKITGNVRLNGQAHLIINQSPYKEGDLILLGSSDAPVYLQVIRITPAELTLGLNQAVQTIRLKY